MERVVSHVTSHGVEYARGVMLALQQWGKVGPAYQGCEVCPPLGCHNIAQALNMHVALCSCFNSGARPGLHTKGVKCVHPSWVITSHGIEYARGVTLALQQQGKARIPRVQSASTPGVVTKPGQCITLTGK